MACLREPAPVSFVVVTVKTSGVSTTPYAPSSVTSKVTLASPSVKDKPVLAHESDEYESGSKLELYTISATSPDLGSVTVAFSISTGFAYITYSTAGSYTAGSNITTICSGFSARPVISSLASVSFVQMLRSYAPSPRSSNL